LDSLFPELEGFQMKSSILYSCEEARKLVLSKLERWIKEYVKSHSKAYLPDTFASILSELQECTYLDVAEPAEYVGPLAMHVEAARTFIGRNGLVCVELDRHNTLYVVCPCLLKELFMLNIIGPLNAYRHRIFQLNWPPHKVYPWLARVQKHMGWSSQFRLMHLGPQLLARKMIESLFDKYPRLKAAEMSLPSVFVFLKMPKGYEGEPPEVLPLEGMRMRVIMNVHGHPAAGVYKDLVPYFSYLLDQIRKRLNLPVAKDSAHAVQLVLQQCKTLGLLDEQLVLSKIDLVEMFPRLQVSQVRSAVKWAANIAFHGKKYLWKMGTSVAASNDTHGRSAVTVSDLLEIVRIELKSRYAALGLATDNPMVLQENGGVCIGGILSALFANIWTGWRLFRCRSVLASMPCAVVGLTDDFLLVSLRGLVHPFVADLSASLGGMKCTSELDLLQCTFVGVHWQCGETGLLCTPLPLRSEYLGHLAWSAPRNRSLLASMPYSTLLRMVNVCSSGEHFVGLGYPVSILRSALRKLNKVKNLTLPLLF
jgi:hypothetical protein